MLTWKEYRNIRKTQFGENRTESKYHFKRYLEFQMKNHPIDCYVQTTPSQRDAVCAEAYDMLYPPVKLGNCTAATPCPKDFGIRYIDPFGLKQEEGNNPMNKMTATTSAVDITLNASAPKSDAMLQRDYLISELGKMTAHSWRDDSWVQKMTDVLVKQFNIGAPMYPQTSQALLDAFAKGEFTTDATKLAKQAKAIADGREYDDEDEYVMRKFYGITFTGLPVEDRKGYELALTAQKEAIKATERTIMVSTPADGLAALIALEGWTYTTPAATPAA